MLVMLSIAVVLLVLLIAVGLYGLRRGRTDEVHNGLRRAGQHPAPAAYEPGAAYARTAGSGGGAL